MIAFGIDIGGTKIELAVVQDGVILNQLRIPTDVQAGFDKIIQDIAAGCQTLSATAKPTAAGVGVAGQIDASTGVLKFGPNLHWRDAPLKSHLESLLGIPVFVTNDVRAAGWGEWLFGAGENAADIVCIFIGTGVGGAVVSDGRMLTGAKNSAGELGHITLELNGPQCTCGNRGCFEAFAGGWAVGKAARAAVENDKESGSVILKAAKGRLNEVSAREVIEAARQGDALALSLVEDVQNAVAAASIGIVNAFNPSRLIFGGGLGLALPGLASFVEAQIQAHALQSSVESLRVLNAQLGENAGAVGAAAYALKCLESTHG